MDIVSSPIFFILMVSTTAVQSNILKGPTNALRKVGDNVTLVCVTSSSNCDGVDWVKMEGAQSSKMVCRDGMILNGYRDGRYSVSSTGGCNLTIAQLNISDSGRFSCAQTVDATQDIKSSVLFVINVTESCLSNVTSSALNQYDRYSFSTSINVPPKSVEPSSVILFFPNKTADETETMNNSQSQTVKTTLTGIARRENITPRVCRVDLAPNTAANFDTSVATLDVCTTQQLIVSYPVENIAVSPPSPYYEGATYRCTADGHPYPTLKWTNLKTGDVVDGDTLVITGEAGDKYNCTATNTVNGKTTSLDITIEVSPPERGCGTGCIIGIVFAVAIVVIGIASFFVYKRVHATSRRI